LQDGRIAELQKGKADFDPQLTFVGLFEDDSRSGGELRVRSTATGAAVVSCHSKAGSCELTSDCVARGRARKGIDEIENGYRETLGTEL
jgi:hypothetical protein